MIRMLALLSAALGGHPVEPPPSPAPLVVEPTDDGARAVRELAKRLRSQKDHVRSGACKSLAKYGPTGAHELTKALGTKYPRTAIQAALAMSEMGADARAELPRVVSLLRDDGPTARRSLDDVVWEVWGVA